jgi:ABC-type polysaccharide/polyol phosphate transport system ATPase subunit
VVYSDSDIILMDDLIAALDAKVKKKDLGRSI